MRRKITGILDIIFAGILIIGPRTFLHVCKGGMKMGNDSGMGEMKMACSNVPNASLLAGIVLAIIGLIFILSGKKKAVGVVSGLLNIALGVVAIGIPTFIVGVCSAPHMHCHMVTKPSLIILGALTVLLGLINSVVELKNVSTSVDKSKMTPSVD